MKQQTHPTSAARSRGLRLLACAAVVSVVVGLALSPNSLAQAPTIERLCDSAFENCRDESSTTTTTVLYWINHEPPTGGIDVSFWFMTDSRYRAALIQAWNRGVPVRVLVDLRADGNSPSNASIRQSLIDAGIPIRHKTTTGINHWKMMLLQGNSTPPAGYPALPPRVHFTGANFANGAYSPEPITNKYQNYVDEAIYFTDDHEIVESFMTKYDDIWLDTVNFQNLANVGPDLVRSHPIYPISPNLNFPPDQDYQDRVVARLKLEPTAGGCGDVPHHFGKNPRPAHQAGAGADPGATHYRPESIPQHDLFLAQLQPGPDVQMAGVNIKWKDDASGQDMHQKSIVLHGVQTGGASLWPFPGHRIGPRLRQTRNGSTTTSRRKTGSLTG